MLVGEVDLPQPNRHRAGRHRSDPTPHLIGLSMGAEGDQSVGVTSGSLLLVTQLLYEPGTYIHTNMRIDT